MKNVNFTFCLLTYILLSSLTSCQKEPEACFTQSSSEVEIGTSLQFLNCTEKGHSFIWDFGDDNSSTLESPTHTFNSAGSYLVSLTAYSKNEKKKDKITKIITVINSISTCGATNVHNPTKTYGSMTDQQGNDYKTIVIGAQEWMAENLKTTIYRNGNAIANLTGNGSEPATGAWAYYNNDSQYDCPNGKLYNWYAVSDPRSLCPTGWHVPSDGEWTTLSDYLGGSSVAGGKMKVTGNQYWVMNGSASNESGFSGLPGGNRYYDGSFGTIGSTGFWWSSSEGVSDLAWYRILPYYNGNIDRTSNDKRLGFSVRCLKD